MNIEHLEYFCVAASLGSLNKAATKLYISQPQLGKIISNLESELGTILMVRTRNGIQLTPEGRQFLTHAEAILSEYKKLHDIRFMEVAKTDVSLQVSMVRFSHILESYMDVVSRHTDEPEYSHTLIEGNSQEVIEDVASHRASVGIIYFDPRRHSKEIHSLKSRHLDYQTLATVSPCLLLREDHPLLRTGTPIHLEDVEQYPFVRFYGEYEDFTNNIRCSGKEYDLNRNDRTVNVSSRSAQLRMIGSSNGFGIGIRHFSMQETSYNVKSIPIENCESLLEFGCILPDDRPATPATHEFIENTFRYFGNLYSLSALSEEDE